MVGSIILPFVISTGGTKAEGSSVPMELIGESGYFSGIQSNVETIGSEKDNVISNPISDIVKSLNIQQETKIEVNEGIVADNGVVSFTPELKVKNGSYSLTKYDKSNLEYGLWYDAYTRIYTVGGKNRIAEISNYPRAYKDTTAHVYTVNTSFIVMEGDLNYYSEGGARYYRDRKEDLFSIGQMAVHFAGEPLPGAFPLWLEYTTLQPVDKASMSFDNTPQPVDIKSMVSVVDSTSKILDTSEVSTVKSTYLSSKAYYPKDTKHQIVYVQYVRKILGE